MSFLHHCDAWSCLLYDGVIGRIGWIFSASLHGARLKLILGSSFKELAPLFTIDQ